MAGDPQPPGRAGGQRHARGDSFGGDMANGPSSSSAGWKREPPQTVQSSTGSSPSRSSFAADSGLLPIVRHSPSRVRIFIISAGVASHSGGVGARRGLLGRRCGEGTISRGAVWGLGVACGSFVCKRCGACSLGAFPFSTFGHVKRAVCAGMSIIVRGQT